MADTIQKKASDWLNSLRRTLPHGRARPDPDQHTRRLEALWQVASVPRSTGVAQQLAMLKAGAAGLRPGHAFYGQLSYLDGNDIVILDGGSQTAQAAERASDQTRLAKGLRYPLDDGPQADVLAAGGTVGWADIRRAPAVAGRLRIREFGGCAAVGTTFLVDGKTHFLMFYSAQPVTPDFTQDDYVYLDVLASFFASHVQQNSDSTTQTRIAENTRRLTALWELARTPEIDDRSRLLTMLEAGAQALNPGHVFYGQLGYQDGADVVIVAGGGGSGDSAPALEPFLAEGVRFTIKDGIQAEVLAASGTIGWADARIPELAHRKRIREYGTRAVIGTKFSVGTRTYFLMFFSLEPSAVLFKVEDYAYVDVLASFFASQLQRRIVRATEIRLVQSLSRSTALREIATKSPRMDDGARLLAMLKASASALRPGQTFHGQLSYRDGDDVVIIASTKTEQEGSENAGGRYRLEDGIQRELLASGGTCAWDDACASPEMRTHTRVRAFGRRAVIGSTFSVGARTHFLIFGSAQPAAEPFTADDCAYVDVLASFFASNLHQGTQRNRIRQQLETDKLTGLPNPATFRTTAMQAMSVRQAYGLAVIDIDQLGHINETRGHQTADALLVEVGAELARLARADEPVGRIGGGTFAILLTDVTSEATALARTRDLLTALKRPYSIGDRFGREHVILGASAGLAYACAGNSYEHLLTKAEAALEAAKAVGPGSLVTFDAKLAAEHTKRRRVHLELENAISQGQLDVVYQPIVALTTMRICGVEALVRWNHPKHGTIMPDAFLPFAAENGLSSQVGRFVIGRIRSDLRAYSDDSKHSIRTYVNLCAAELADQTFIAEIHALLTGDPALASRLGIDAAESVALRDPVSTGATLEKLKIHGLRIAVDNVGTGAISIANLKKLPIDILKIAGSLIAALPGDRDAVAIVEALFSIARTFGFETIAQGVETIEQLAWLKSRGCTMAQGIAIARPMGVEPLRERLMSRKELSTTA